MKMIVLKTTINYDEKSQIAMYLDDGEEKMDVKNNWKLDSEET